MSLLSDEDGESFSLRLEDSGRFVEVEMSREEVWALGVEMVLASQGEREPGVN